MLIPNLREGIVLGYSKLPLGTVFILGLCAFIHVGFIIGPLLDVSWQINDFSLAAFPVFQLHQYYRLVTSAFLHANIWHILANLSALLSLGPRIETSTGSFVLLALILTIAVFSNLLYCVVCYVINYMAVMMTIKSAVAQSWLHYHTVGLSGVLFSLMVINGSIESNEGGDNTGSNPNFFGLIPRNTINARYIHRIYPWLLLVLIQFLFSRASWLGHLIGIIVGHLCTYGAFDYILPSTRYIAYMEGQNTMVESRCVCFQLPRICVSNSLYIQCRERPHLIEPRTTSLNGQGSWTGRTAFNNDMELLRRFIEIVCAPVLYYKNKCLERRTSESSTQASLVI
uniref:Peptidase S54 rhomboid domain-containing protein n=1 Tax=Aplanochytrium stocchinoi TaxID=215587 RepID=A0A7S3UZT1_9STRA